MKINTKNFGNLEIEEKDIINFPEGLPAFEDQKDFIIINMPKDENPFQWLQAINNPKLAFVIINPFIFKKDYDFKIPQTLVKKLQIDKEEDIAVYVIVVVPKDINKMTANLKAPVIINTKKMLGKQLILDNSRYNTKHLIIEETAIHRQED